MSEQTPEEEGPGGPPADYYFQEGEVDPEEYVEVDSWLAKE